MYVAALQTARAGSQGVIGKNTMKIKEKPLFLHNLIYAKNSKKINDVFVSTDDPQIKSHAKKEKFQIIDRPSSLRSNTASHWETMMHGLETIEKENHVDILVVLFGNSLGAYTEDLDVAIDKLSLDPKLDSIMSVSEANFHNPFRAYKKTGELLNTIVPQDFIRQQANGTISDRNSAGNIYFFNGSFWIMKRKALVECKGLEPFPWLGNKIFPYEQDPVLQEVDLTWQATLLQHAEV